MHLLAFLCNQIYYNIVFLKEELFTCDLYFHILLNPIPFTHELMEQSLFIACIPNTLLLVIMQGHVSLCSIMSFSMVEVTQCISALTPLLYTVCKQLQKFWRWVLIRLYFPWVRRCSNSLNSMSGHWNKKVRIKICISIKKILLKLIY